MARIGHQQQRFAVLEARAEVDDDVHGEENVEEAVKDVADENNKNEENTTASKKKRKVQESEEGKVKNQNNLIFAEL